MKWNCFNQDLSSRFYFQNVLRFYNWLDHAHLCTIFVPIFKKHLICTFSWLGSYLCKSVNGWCDHLTDDLTTSPSMQCYFRTLQRTMLCLDYIFFLPLAVPPSLWIALARQILSYFSLISLSFLNLFIPLSLTLSLSLPEAPSFSSSLLLSLRTTSCHFMAFALSVIKFSIRY